MTTIATARPTIQRPQPEYLVDDAQLAGGVPRALQRSDAQGLPPRPAGLVPVDVRQPGGSAGGDSPADRAVPLLDGGTGPGGINDRSAALDGVRLLPLRSRRRARPFANPAQYVCRPQVHPSDTRGLDRSELGLFLFTAEQYDRDHGGLAVLLGHNGLRVSEACATNVEDLGLDRGHRTLRILCKAASL
jgi:hypothetical protein